MTMRGFHRERGSMAVTIGILIVPLLAMGVFVFDWGAILHERRQLQNGADAAALDVAEACALGDCELADPEALINANASDEINQLEELHIDPVLQTVTVLASSLDPQGRSFVRFFFGRLPFVGETLTDDEGTPVEATAVAQWGGIGAATTVPLALPQCAFDFAQGLEEGDLVIFMIKKGGNDPGEKMCDADESGSGSAAPGNFRWLDSDDCRVTTASEEWILAGDPGNAKPSTLGCDPSDFQEGQRLMFPIYSDVSGQGAGTEFQILGFAVLEVTRFKLHNANDWRFPSNFNCEQTGPSQDVTCIEGTFVEFVSLDAGLGGPDGDGFARAVALVE